MRSISQDRIFRPRFELGIFIVQYSCDSQCHTDIAVVRLTEDVGAYRIFLLLDPGMELYPDSSSEAGEIELLVLEMDVGRNIVAFRLIGQIIYI